MNIQLYRLEAGRDIVQGRFFKVLRSMAVGARHNLGPRGSPSQAQLRQQFFLNTDLGRHLWFGRISLLAAHWVWEKGCKFEATHGGDDSRTSIGGTATAINSMEIWETNLKHHGLQVYKVAPRLSPSLFACS